MLKFIKKNYFLLIVLGIFIYTMFVDINITKDITLVTWENLNTFLSFVPPIFVLIGLLDVFVSKEMMIKHMGPDSGLLGFFYAFLLGSLAAGPLYMAFPIAAILLKKQAHIRYIVFFFGIWTTLKLPILIYEFTNFGFVFTMTNIVLALLIFLVGSYIFEYLLSKKDKETISNSAISMLKD